MKTNWEKKAEEKGDGVRKEKSERGVGREDSFPDSLLRALGGPHNSHFHASPSSVFYNWGPLLNLRPPDTSTGNKSQRFRVGPIPEQDIFQEAASILSVQSKGVQEWEEWFWTWSKVQCLYYSMIACLKGQSCPRCLQGKTHLLHKSFKDHWTQPYGTGFNHNILWATAFW